MGGHNYSLISRGVGAANPAGSGAVDKEASQTRDYCVAKNATRRAARSDPSLRKERLFRMTIELHHCHPAAASCGQLLMLADGTIRIHILDEIPLLPVRSSSKATAAMLEGVIAATRRDLSARTDDTGNWGHTVAPESSSRAACQSRLPGEETLLIHSWLLLTKPWLLPWCAIDCALDSNPSNVYKPLK